MVIKVVEALMLKICIRISKSIYKEVEKSPVLGESDDLSQETVK